MYKVIKNFIDKETSKKYLAEAEHKPTSAKRGNELVSKGFLKEIKETKKGAVVNEPGETK